MSSFSQLIKAEVTRLARKEVKAQVEHLRKQSATHRRDIAALKREVGQLHRELARVAKGTAGSSRRVAAESADDSQGTSRRFSPERLKATRAKLGISAAEFASLIGVSGQSVYLYESGRARPRAGVLERIAQVRGLGKREVAARLGEAEAA